MYEIKASHFVEVLICLQQAIALSVRPDFLGADFMTDANKEASRSNLDRLAEHLTTLDVPVTKMTLEDTYKALKASQVRYVEYGQMAFNLSNTIKRELKTKKIYVLEQAKCGFFDPREPLFGAVVSSQFPGIVYEIEQSGKCYACDLSTASAFHSIRCLEAGIRAISRCLGIPDPTKGSDRSWFKVLGSIKNAIDVKWPPSTRISGDGQLFDEIHGAIAAIQNPIGTRPCILIAGTTRQKRFIYTMPSRG